MVTPTPGFQSQSLLPPPLQQRSPTSAGILITAIIPVTYLYMMIRVDKIFCKMYSCNNIPLGKHDWTPPLSAPFFSCPTPLPVTGTG